MKNKDLFKSLDDNIWSLQVINSMVRLRRKHIDGIIKILKYYGRLLKDKIIFWFNVLLKFAISKKPREFRMGRGKGKNVGLVGFVKPGQVVLEFELENRIIALKILKFCKKLLPKKTIANIKDIW